MSSRTEQQVAALVLLGLALVGCSRSEDLGEASDTAARVTKVAGEASRVTLTRPAQTALGIRTQRVQEVPPGDAGVSPAVQAIPYSAVLYDARGRTWAFTVTGPRTYQRSPITLDHVAEDVAYLRQSLPSSASVVTVGAPELLGAEEGVGGE